MKKIILLIAAIAAVGTGTLPAQVSQFSQPTLLQTATNSATLSTAIGSIYVPAISLTITATNNAAIVTNTLTQVITVTNITTFVYSAATMGTSFTTNFPAYYQPFTNRLYGTAAPQFANSNNVSIQ